MLTKEAKTRVVKSFQTHEKDSGSTPVQIAVLTSKIQQLSDHLKVHKKDYASRRGLLVMVSNRSRLLKYLEKSDPKSHTEVIEKLGLKK